MCTYRTHEPGVITCWIVQYCRAALLSDHLTIVSPATVDEETVTVNERSLRSHEVVTEHLALLTLDLGLLTLDLTFLILTK